MSSTTPVKSTTYAEATEAEKHAVLRKVTGSWVKAQKVCS